MLGRAVTACRPGPRRYRTSSGSFLRRAGGGRAPPLPPSPQPSSRGRASFSSLRPLRAPRGFLRAAAAGPRPAPREGPRAGRARPGRPRVPPPPPAVSALYLETSARRILLATGPWARPTSKPPPRAGSRRRGGPGSGAQRPRAGGPAALHRPRSSRSAVGPRLLSPKMGLNLCAAPWERRDHAPGG